jgi:hypothetical protein
MAAGFATLKAAVALLFVFLLAFVVGTGAKRQPAGLDGYVYQKCVDDRLVGSVRGAVVSTSVDATTATTDAAGHFHLLTKSPVFSDEFHDVTVRYGGVVVDEHFGILPPGKTVHVAFVLSPPERVLAVRDSKSGEVSCHSLPFRRALARQEK